jgi:hypothetical protein
VSNDPTSQQGRAHARLSGSVASIFTVCTGAPELWKGRVRSATGFTREGTAAHEIAEGALLDGLTPAAGDVILVEGEFVTVTDEMLEGVAGYVAHVNLMKRDAEWYAIERTFDLKSLWEQYGQTIPEPMFGSADFVGIKGTRLTVMDLKFGKGIPVTAEGNAQLLYYGIGAYLWLSENHPDMARRMQTVRLVICQPRVRDELSDWEIDVIDLLHWAANTLKQAVDDITAGKTQLKAGKHCQFCLGKGVCPELAAESMRAAKSVFPPMPVVDLTDQELSDAYHKADVLSIWMNGVRAELETRVKNGREFEDWKLVEKRANRAWGDEREAVRMIAERTNGIRHEFMTEPELLSPAQAEKKAKSLGFDPKTLLDGLIVTPVTGTTVVPASDQRPAIVTGAANVFSKVV